jgi:FkbM family methyltransferase
LTARILYVPYKLKKEFRYCRAFRNWFEVLARKYLRQARIRTVTTRSGEVVPIDSAMALYTYSLFYSMKPDDPHRPLSLKFEDDILTVESRSTGRAIVLKGVNDNGDPETFFDPILESIDVTGLEVIDVGANIGETAIYFASRGAAHVYAYEPFPASHDTAVENVALNGMEGKVTLSRAAVSGRSGNVNLSAAERGLTLQLHPSTSGVATPITTLDEIVESHHIHDAVVKIDCEGCEYSAIELATTATLAAFRSIVLEFHYGYRRIKARLEDCGFTVRVVPERHLLWHPIEKMYTGYLIATRRDVGPMAQRRDSPPERNSSHEQNDDTPRQTTTIISERQHLGRLNTPPRLAAGPTMGS